MMSDSKLSKTRATQISHIRVWDRKAKDTTIRATETFDTQKLFTIIKNKEKLIKTDEFKEAPGHRDPFELCQSYLDASRAGRVATIYRQRNSYARLHAVGGLSLQRIPRRIRHTICGMYYHDVDIVNAGMCIIDYICKACDIKPPKPFTDYLNNREKILAETIKNVDSGKYSFDLLKEVNRDTLKRLYVSLMYGASLPDSGEDLYPYDHHIAAFGASMRSIIRSVTALLPDEFKTFKAAREKENSKSTNHGGAFLNFIVQDIENQLLMEMYKFFGSPRDCVLVFDGIQVRKGRKRPDLGRCEEDIRGKFPGLHFKLKIKPMDEVFSSLELDYYGEYKDPTAMGVPTWFSGYRKMIEFPTVLYSDVMKWITSSVAIIDNSGKQFLITADILRKVNQDGIEYKKPVWTPVDFEELKKSLNVVVNVANPHYDRSIAIMTKKERVKNGITREEFAKCGTRQMFGNLGATSLRYGVGALEYCLTGRKLSAFDRIDFVPFLRRKGVPKVEGILNTFTEFRYDTGAYANIPTIVYPSIPFEGSRFYNHLMTDFFSYDAGEFDHFLNFIADIVQDPLNIKGTAHVFHSRQGCGKGLLLHFLRNLIDEDNVCVIVSPEAYFESRFNAHNAGKLLKVFEELSEHGAGYKYRDRLKAELTSNTERVEPKGKQVWEQTHCARYIFFTNNEGSVHLDSDDRRFTLHSISDSHANNRRYFGPIWEEVKNPRFMLSAFEFFATKDYKKDSVRSVYKTAYKLSQQILSLPTFLKYVDEEISNFLPNPDAEVVQIFQSHLRDSFMSYCNRINCRYSKKVFETGYRSLGLPEFTRNGNGDRRLYIKISGRTVLEAFRRYMKCCSYVLSCWEGTTIDELPVHSYYMPGSDTKVVVDEKDGYSVAVAAKEISRAGGKIQAFMSDRENNRIINEFMSMVDGLRPLLSTYDSYKVKHGTKTVHFDHDSVSDARVFVDAYKALRSGWSAHGTEEEMKEGLDSRGKPEETKQEVVDEPEETKQEVVDEPEETKQEVVDEPEETKQEVVDEPEETKQEVVDEPEETKQEVVDEPEETKSDEKVYIGTGLTTDPSKTVPAIVSEDEDIYDAIKALRLEIAEVKKNYELLGEDKRSDIEADLALGETVESVCTTYGVDALLIEQCLEYEIIIIMSNDTTEEEEEELVQFDVVGGDYDDEYGRLKLEKKSDYLKEMEAKADESAQFESAYKVYVRPPTSKTKKLKFYTFDRAKQLAIAKTLAEGDTKNKDALIVKAAAKAQVKPHIIRNWIERGVLHPVGQTKNGIYFKRLT